MVLPGISLCLLAAASALYAFALPVYTSVMTVVMHWPFQTPFFDFEFLLTTARCWHQGIDVYVTNPCDVLDRPMNYSPLWLRLRFLAIDRAWSLPLGLGVTVCFCLSLGFLVPTNRWRDQVIIGLAAASSLVIYAVERCNVDVLVYLAAILAGFALAGTAMTRVVSYLLLMAMGLLKFYPFVALAVIVRERLAVCAALAGLAGAGIVAFVLAFREELGKVAQNLPDLPLFEEMLGARLLPAGLGLMLKPLLGIDAAELIPVLPLVIGLLFLGAACGGALWLIYGTSCRAVLARFPARERAFLFIGAALLTGCFFAGPSAGYRAIHLLLVLPALLLIDDPATPVGLKLAARMTIMAIFVILVRGTVLSLTDWSDESAQISAVAASAWLAYQLAWWWTVSMLMGFLGCLILASRAVQDAASLIAARLAGRPRAV